MTITNINTLTYDMGNGHYMDIVTNGNKIEEWIYHKDYCLKHFIWGTENISLPAFLTISEENFDADIADYEMMIQEQ